jgi:hypothetical protein
MEVFSAVDSRDMFEWGSDSEASEMPMGKKMRFSEPDFEQEAKYLHAAACRAVRRIDLNDSTSLWAALVASKQGWFFTSKCGLGWVYSKIERIQREKTIPSDFIKGIHYFLSKDDVKIYAERKMAELNLMYNSDGKLLFNSDDVEDTKKATAINDVGEVLHFLFTPDKFSCDGRHCFENVIQEASFENEALALYNAADSTLNRLRSYSTFDLEDFSCVWKKLVSDFGWHHSKHLIRADGSTCAVYTKIRDEIHLDIDGDARNIPDLYSSASGRPFFQENIDYFIYPASLMNFIHGQLYARIRFFAEKNRRSSEQRDGYFAPSRADNWDFDPHTINDMADVCNERLTTEFMTSPEIHMIGALLFSEPKNESRPREEIDSSAAVKLSLTDDNDAHKEILIQVPALTASSPMDNESLSSVSSGGNEKSLRTVINEVKEMLSSGLVVSTSGEQKFICREQEFRTIRETLLPCLLASKATDNTKSSFRYLMGTSIYLTGRPGVGKTMTKNAILDSLSSLDVDISTRYPGCVARPYCVSNFVGPAFPRSYSELACRILEDDIEGYFDNDTQYIQSESSARNWMLSGIEYPSGSNGLRPLRIIVIDEIDMAPTKIIQDLVVAAPSSGLVILGLGNTLCSNIGCHRVIMFDAYSSAQLESILVTYTRNLFEEKCISMLAKSVSNPGKYVLSSF